MSLLGLFRIIMGVSENRDSYLIVQEVVNQLPKPRQAEIQKRVEQFESQFAQGGHQPDGGAAEALSSRYTSNDERQSRGRSRGFSAKSGKRGKSGNQKSSERARKNRTSDLSQKNGGESAGGDGGEHHVSPMKSVGKGQDQMFLFQTKKAQSNVSTRYQASLSDVILTIKNISQDQDRLRTSQIVENFDLALTELADGGIKECKAQIITCIFWLFTNYPQKINFLEHDRQEAVKALLNFMKKLYCYERFISKQPKTPEGDSLELFQAASSIVICYVLLHADGQSHKLVSQLLYILLIAAAESGLMIVSYVNVLKHILAKYDPCPRQIRNGRALIISNIVYFVSDKLQEIIQKSQQVGQQQQVQLTDFEDFRSIAIQ